MTRDEARAKCIEAMALAFVTRWQDGGSRLDCMTAAFDSLNGVAFVDPLEATEEMRVAGVTCGGIDPPPESQKNAD